jgi:hypothetical protein
MNIPWSFFDLSEARLYQGDDKEFLSIRREGLPSCTSDWQPRTHRESLELLQTVKPPIPALGVALTELAAREQALMQPMQVLQ